MEPLYKIVGPEGECLNGGTGDWPLPCAHDMAADAVACYNATGRTHGYGPEWAAPGEWRSVDGPLEACRNGLHLATRDQLPTWLHGTRPHVVYRVETDGPLIDAGEKWVAQRVRLLPRSRPMPDYTEAAAKRQRAKDRAYRILNRARRASPIPAQWRAYLNDIGSARLPEGHPGAPYQALAAADRAADAVATHKAAVAVRKADDAYAREIAEGAMPE